MRAEGWRRALAGASTPCALSSTHETIRRAALCVDEGKPTEIQGLEDAS